MSKWKLLVLLVLFAANLQAQKKRFETDIYFLRHSVEDSLRIKENNESDALRMRILSFREGSNLDTFHISAVNNGKNQITGIKICLFKGFNNILIETLSISALEAGKTAEFSIQVEKDTIYNFVYSDFSNSTQHIQYKPNDRIRNLQYNGFTIDDSTPVSRLEDKPFKVDGKVEKGEKIRCSFIFSNLDVADLGQLKGEFVSLQGDVVVKPVKANFNTIDSARGDGTLIFDISTSLMANNITGLLRLYLNASVCFEKQILIEYGRSYRIYDSRKPNTSESEYVVNSRVTRNLAEFSFTFSPVQLERRLSSSIYLYQKGDTSNFVAINRYLMGNDDIVRIGLPKDGIYRARVTITEGKILRPKRIFCLKYTPSIINDKFYLANQKLGMRFMQFKSIGYYVEANSTLSNYNGEYVYNSERQILENFDYDNKYFISTSKLTPVTRDFGMGAVFRLNSWAFISGGMNYLSYRVKQEILEYSYLNNTSPIRTDVLLKSESYSKIIYKASFNLMIRKVLLGFEIANYNKSNKSMRMALVFGMNLN
jgi:hypothetical protein